MCPGRTSPWRSTGVRWGRSTCKRYVQRCSGDGTLPTVTMTARGRSRLSTRPWPTAIGRDKTRSASDCILPDAGRRWLVSANAKYRRLGYDTAPLVLIPILQSYQTFQVLYVRVAGNPLSYGSSVERTVHGLNSDLPLFNETTLAANMRMGNAF